MAGIDRTTGEWNEYARLVLAELERHNGLLITINGKLDDIKLQQALTERELRDLKASYEDFKTKTNKEIDRFNEKFDAIDSGDLVKDAVGRYKKWIVGAIFTLITAVAIPLINILSDVKWGGS